MRVSKHLPAGNVSRRSEDSGERAALHAVRKARKAATLLERGFRLMAEDDSIQPAIKHVYAALCEAETRARVMEDWYERTYAADDLPVKPPVAQSCEIISGYRSKEEATWLQQARNRNSTGRK